MDNTDPRAIIFDFGGTLDTGGDHWSEIIFDAYRAVGLNLGREEFSDAYIYAERTLGREAIIAPGSTFAETLDIKIALQFDRLCNRGHLPDGADSLAGEISEICYNHALAHIRQARPLLQRLGSHYPLALVSNFYGNITAVLHEFGIRDCFRAVIESAMIGLRKPDPRLFSIAATALGVNPADCLVIGDSVDKDIIPARSIGCNTALLTGRRWYKESQPPTTWPSYNSLEEIAEAILNPVNKKGAKNH